MADEKQLSYLQVEPDTRKQDLLISGQTIKTINGINILGSGNIVISGGGGTTNAVWGNIAGNLQDQTDLIGLLNGKEASIAASTVDTYWRGDKTFQVLNTTAVAEATNLYYTEARVNANANVAANTAARHNAVTLGTANGLSLAGQALSLLLAGSATTGALSNTDWNTFNSKQNALGFTPENVANKNQANGYAGLDGSGKINPLQLPSIAITDTFVVGSQAAMLALNVEVGDVAVRTDVNKSFILRVAPATSLANWQELLTPVSVDQSIIDGSSNAVSGNAVFDALAGKQNTISGPINYLTKFGTGGVVASSIFDSGNVVDINNPVRIITNDAQGFRITNQADNNKQVFIGYDSTTNVSSIQSIQLGTSARPLALNPIGGNVSIGNPLTLAWKATTDGVFGSIDTKNQYVWLGMEADKAVLATDWYSGYGGSARPFEIRTGGAARMLIDQVGNVTFNNTVVASPATQSNHVATLGQFGSNAFNSTAFAPLLNPEFSGSVKVPNATLATEAVNKGQLDAVARPYKIYTALLTQSGTNAPVATVLENTLGGTVNWSRSTTGTYLGQLTGAFVSGKTFVHITRSFTDAASQKSIPGASRGTNDWVSVRTFDLDDQMTNTNIQILVYL